MSNKIIDAITTISQATNEEMLATGLFNGAAQLHVIQGMSTGSELRQVFIIFRPGLLHHEREQALRHWLAGCS